MGTLVIRHKVKQYSKWRPWFDQHAMAPRSAELTNPRVFRSPDDKNEVVILFDTDDSKRAKHFVASLELKETMARAGVSDSPTVYFLESAIKPMRNLSVRDGLVEALKADTLTVTGWQIGMYGLMAFAQ